MYRYSTLKMLLIVVSVFYAACDTKPNSPSAYDAELRSINNKLAAIDESSEVEFAHDRAVAKIHYLYQRAALTGSYSDLAELDAAIQEAIAVHGAAEEFLIQRALVDFKLHKFAEASGHLEQLAGFSLHPKVPALRADIALQQGDYATALSGFRELIKVNPSWDNLSRLAYYNAKTGSPEEADELYAMAGDTVSVKEMRTYAWIELQRGLLDLEFYRYNEALAHYQRADRAFSGYWLIEEHIAEVLALLGHTEEAEKLYRSVVEKAENPELLAALAEVVAEEAPAEAAALFARADALFSEQYGNYPAAAAGHFIEHLLQRPQVDENLLAYAERNYQARPNAESQFLLARVYRKFQDEASARAALRAVLEAPWRTPEIEQMAQELGLLPTAG